MKRPKLIKEIEYKPQNDCPLSITSCLILFDESRGRTFLRFRPILKEIKAAEEARILIECFDGRGNLLSRLDNVKYDNEVDIPSWLTKDIKIAVRSVRLADGRLWMPKAAEYLKSEQISVNQIWDEQGVVEKPISSESEEALKKKSHAPAWRRRLIKTLIFVLCAAVLTSAAYCVWGYFTLRDDSVTRAKRLYNNAAYGEAYKEFSRAEEFWAPKELKNEISYYKGLSAYGESDYYRAMKDFAHSGGYEDSAERLREITQMFSGRIAAGDWHSVTVLENGSVQSAGDNSAGQCDTKEWSGIKAVAAAGNHTVGLSESGRVVAAGSNDYGESQLDSWENIVMIAAGTNHSVGLKSDGTVSARGDNTSGQCLTTDWRDIVAVAAGAEHTVGLKSDGTVVAAGANRYGECNVSELSGVVSIAAGEYNTLCVMQSGAVKVFGNNDYEQCDTSAWSDVIYGAVGNNCVFGIKPTGKAIAVGANELKQSSVMLWDDVIAIASGKYHTAGLSNSGELYFVGSDKFGQSKLRR